MRRQIYKKVINLPQSATSGYFLFSLHDRDGSWYLYDVCSSMTGELIFSIPIKDYNDAHPRFLADFSLIDNLDEKVRKLFPVIRRSQFWRADTWEELFSYFDRFLNVEAYKDLGYWYDESEYLPFESLQESLNESLRTSSLSELENLIDTDEEINELFLTPINELPEGYRHLAMGPMQNMTLYDLILQYENLLGCKYVLQYKDGKPAGLIFYVVNEEENGVDEINMFSFDLKSNNAEMLSDLRRFLNELLEKYDYVKFAGNNNTAVNKIYQRIVSKYPNHRERNIGSLGVTKYTIYK